MVSMVRCRTELFEFEHPAQHAKVRCIILGYHCSLSERGWGRTQHTYRYFASSPFDALTVERDNPGASLQKKMKQYMAPWAHPLLFDTTLNLLRTSYENAYSLALLCATKSYAHMRSLPKHSGKPNTSFVIKSIEHSVVYLSQLIRRRISNLRARSNQSPATASSDGGGRGDCQLRPDFIVWLGLHAFRSVLESKGSERNLGPVCEHLLSLLNLPRYMQARSVLAAPARSLAQTLIPKFAWNR